MSENDDFWDDLLGHIGDRALVTITGPDLNIVATKQQSQTLTQIIAQQLMDKYSLDLSHTKLTMGAAAATFFRKCGRDEEVRLYRVVNDIIATFDGQPCAPLHELAKITNIRLFVSTTPDRLLAQAINAVRFQGEPLARELTYSPNQSTEDQAENLHVPGDAETVIVRLFGQAASTPQYAMHEEDLLEWLHSLISGSGHLPEWVSHALRHQPLLFIGCEIPDWLGRFLLRMSSRTRIALDKRQFFIAHSSEAEEPLLSDFFTTYCRRTQVQQLSMNPADFVVELRDRWLARLPPAGDQNLAGSTLGDPNTHSLPNIFISYMREDVASAQRLRDAIVKMGGEVWFDQYQVRPGDAWKITVSSSIRRTVRLFIPVISANTEMQDEGYVFHEWVEAVERSKSIVGRRFIIPVIIDGNMGELGACRHIPEAFRDLDFGTAPTGEPDSRLRSLLIEEIRAIRRVA